MDGTKVRRIRAAIASLSVAGLTAVAVLAGGSGAGAQTRAGLAEARQPAQRASAALDGAATAPTNECFGPYLMDGVLDRRTFFVGPNNTLQQTYWNGSQWVNQTLPGKPASSTVPAGLIGVGTAGQQYVFFEGTNGTLQQTYWDGTQWQNQTLPGTPAPGTSLAALSCVTPEGFVEDVFFVGPNGNLQETSYNGHAWQTETLPGAPAGSSLTASWYGAGMALGYEANAHVFFHSPSGALEQTYWNGSAWANQVLPGNPETETGLTSQFQLTAAGSSSQHVYFVAPGGVMEQTYWDGSTWRNQILPGGPAEADTSLAVSNFTGSGGSESVHVFFVGSASTGYPLEQTYWNGSTWRAQILPGDKQARGLTSSIYISNLAEDAFGEQTFFTSGTKVEQTYWNGITWQTQVLPGKAAG